MKRCFSTTNAQHAPSAARHSAGSPPRPDGAHQRPVDQRRYGFPQQPHADQRQDGVGNTGEQVLPGPVHGHERRRGRRRLRRRQADVLRFLFAGDDFAGGLVASGHGSASPLEGDSAVVPVHERRDGQAHRQVHQHDDGDALDRLTGLVDRGVGDADQVREADGHRQRRVLGQVEVLAGQRRDDHPERLRQQDQPHHQRLAQAEREARLGLAMGDGEDAAAHDLGDVGAGVEHEPDEQGGELRAQRGAALEIEALELGRVHGGGRAAEQPGHQRQADNQREPDPERRKDLAGPLLALARPYGDAPGRQNAGDQRHHHGRHGSAPVGNRNAEPAVAEKHARDRIVRLARARQSLGDQRVPEEQLQQHRDVPEPLDVEGRELGDQPVARQPGDAGDRRR